MLKDFYTEFSLLKKNITTDDGAGGSTTTHKEPIYFAGGLSILSSQERLSNEKLGVDSTHSLLCDKTIKVNYNDVIVSSVNGFKYKVVNNPLDETIPLVSNLNIQKITLKKL
ncbi:MAG: hypothetical protein ACRDDY_02550 [Clostridium sp.]|uniref:hypothetical protein n=1 Tax=Clostridium TaxID=1485 RepID=UPI003EE600EF